AEGSFTVDAASSDGSGNSASVSGSGSIDTIAPLLTVNDPGTGNDNTPTITGSGEVGAVVTVVVTDSLGNTQTIETVVDAD
ncbi:RTX toxin, partial [Alteromonas sp. LMIT007]|nr:RTX toxin [Opacimonas viscosa]